MKKEYLKIILLLLVLGVIIYGTVKINNSDIKPIITLKKEKSSEKKQETTKEEKKEEPAKEEIPEEPTADTPPENPVTSSIIPTPDGTSKTILCTHAENTSTGTPFTLEILAYYEKAGGTMNKVQIYTAVEATNLTPEEKTELATLLEREISNKHPSFTAKNAVTETEVQVLLEGTPENLINDYKILDNTSIEYYNYAPTLRYEGYTCTIN